MPRRLPPLAAAAAIMLLGSGPTLLAVDLATELHGRRVVAAAAMAFTVGTLIAPALATLLERRRLRPSLTWPLLGLGMIIGWAAAPVNIAGLLAAQLLSGASMSTFEGTVDAHVAARTPPNAGATASLAWSAAARALGSAVAVGTTPTIVATAGLGTLSGGVVFALLAVTVGGLLIRLKKQAVETTPGEVPIVST